MTYLYSLNPLIYIDIVLLRRKLVANLEIMDLIPAGYSKLAIDPISFLHVSHPFHIDPL